ncbi:MAG: Ig-like domain-containing protein [Clostridia bacterium]|nr:Ig-like domain-containing protein [Clostridia bacterium]
MFKKLFYISVFLTALVFASAYAASSYKVSPSVSSITMSPGESRTVTVIITPVNLMDHAVTWESENPYVASVSKKGEITAHAAGSTIITATIETGASCRVSIRVKGNPVTMLELSDEEIQLEAGQSVTLTYKTNDSADDKRVKWSSSDTAVATVNSSGTVKAVGGGIAVITLTAVNGMTDTAVIYVPSDVKRVELYPEELYLGIGASAVMDAYVFPGNARDREIIWETNDQSVATVDSDGVVTGTGSGTCYVRAMTANGKYALSTLHVSALPVSIDFSKNTVVLSKEKRTFQIETVISPETASDCVLTWESSDISVVAVQDGMLNAKGYGVAYVKATSLNGISAELTVYVCEAPESVRFSSSVYLVPSDGGQVSVQPVFSPENSMAEVLVYSTSDASVATIDENGVLKPVSYGSCTVTLKTSNGLECSADVRVYENARALYAAESSLILPQYSFKELEIFSESGKPYLSELAVSIDDENVCVYTGSSLYARAPGRAEITISSPGTSLTTKINVTVTESQGFNAKMHIALTFDNGPDAYTADILRVLGKYGVKATFFLLGENVKAHSETAALYSDTEHELGNHTYNNSSVASDSLALTAEYLERTDSAVLKACGRTPTVLRAPDALLPSALFTSLLDTRRFIYRGINANDTDGSLTASEIAGAMLSEIYDSCILTFHDCGKNTAAALDILIPELLERGCSFLTVSELIDYTGMTEGLFSTKR